MVWFSLEQSTFQCNVSANSSMPLSSKICPTVKMETTEIKCERNRWKDIKIGFRSIQKKDVWSDLSILLQWYCTRLSFFFASVLRIRNNGRAPWPNGLSTWYGDYGDRVHRFKSQLRRSIFFCWHFLLLFLSLPTVCTLSLTMPAVLASSTRNVGAKKDKNLRKILAGPSVRWTGI